MKTQYVSLLVLPILSLTLGLSSVTEARDSRAVKTGVASLCTALLATGTAGAVVVTKVLGTNPQGSFTSRQRLFQDRHALLVFLGNAIGGRFADKATIGAEVEIAQYDSPPDQDEQALERLAAGTTEEQVIRAIHIDKVNTEKGSATGFLILNGVLGRIHIVTTPANTQEYTVYDLVSQKLIFQGAWKLKLKSA